VLACNLKKSRRALISINERLISDGVDCGVHTRRRSAIGIDLAQEICGLLRQLDIDVRGPPADA
jgi:hypothetical protein